MTAKTINSPTKKLASLREKIAALQQEEAKICSDLSHELSQHLVNAQALDIDFNVLMGGLLDVISQSKTDAVKVEMWQKSGQKFLQEQSRREQEKERLRK